MVGVTIDDAPLAPFQHLPPLSPSTRTNKDVQNDKDKDKDVGILQL